MPNLTLPASVIKIVEGVDEGEEMLAGSLALLVAALFTGAALYVNLVEQPARLGLDDASVLAEWKLSYRRGAAMQASLSLVGFGLSIVAGHQGSWLWFFGGIVLLANWPYTFLCVAPLNRKIRAFVPGSTQGQLHRLVGQWGHRHAVRTALGTLACLIFILANT
jgi:Domain of unknown function (DUF1772)